MAKDNRAKRKAGQVSLATASGSKNRKKKKKVPVGTVIIRVMVGVLVGLSLTFIGVVIFGIVSSFNSGGNEHNVVLNTYDTTPEAESKKVSYFLVGLTGGDESDMMDMVSLVCFDKKAKTVRVLQVPADTYIGNSDAWAVSRVGKVWSNPTPLVWCDTCRGRVYEPEQQGGKHATCGTPLTTKTGSSVESLLSVFNDQYSMPVDNFFILSPDTLKQMVDAVGGIDVQLETAMKVGEISYPAGKQILSGEAALYYVTDYNFNGTPAQDSARLMRQRKVWVALLQRMAAMSREDLQKNVITPVMTGANPIRSNNDAASVAKMLAGIYSGKTDNVTFAEALSRLIDAFDKVDPGNCAFYLMPGQTGKQGTATYFGVNKPALVTLLKDKFNPYGLELKEEHLQVATLAGVSGTVDVKEQTMKQIAVEQSAATTAATQ